MATFVIDASATLPWCLKDEETAWTIGLLRRLNTGDRIIVPAHWPTEGLQWLADGDATPTHPSGPRSPLLGRTRNPSNRGRGPTLPGPIQSRPRAMRPAQPYRIRRSLSGTGQALCISARHAGWRPAESSIIGKHFADRMKARGWPTARARMLCSTHAGDADHSG